MAFLNFRSPPLPLPPDDYQFGYFMDLIRSLGVSFGAIDSRAGITVEKVVSDVVQLPFGALASSNGANNNVTLPNTSFVRITGPSGSFSITGIQPGASPNGRLAILYNTTSQDMTISHNSSSSATANRIYTNTGSDVATTGTGVVIHIYSVTDSRWILLSSLT